MPTLTSFSQQFRAQPTEVADAAALRVNFANVNAPGNPGVPVVLTPPTDAQLGREVYTANGAVRQPGTPFYAVSARRPYAVPDSDPCIIIVDADGTGANVST